MAWLFVWSECRLAYGPADAIATSCLASVKSRLVLPFWYRLTWVVLEKGPLNGCVCVARRTRFCRHPQHCDTVSNSL